MAEVIGGHKSLTELDLCNIYYIILLAENYIGDVGAEALVQAASKNEKMKYLNICMLHSITFISRESLHNGGNEDKTTRQ